MDAEQDVCLRELRAILACDENDEYIKERAKYWIEVIEHQTHWVVDVKKVPALAA
jgi:hypothetical protein